ncbi:TPA: phage tail protein I, partial [Klebsiella pneumoniae]
LTPKTLDELNRLIGDAKPVSRHLAQMTISTSARGNAWIGVAPFDGTITTVYPPGYTPDDSIYFDGAAHYSGNYYFSGEQK